MTVTPSRPIRWLLPIGALALTLLWFGLLAKPPLQYWLTCVGPCPHALMPYYALHRFSAQGLPMHEMARFPNTVLVSRRA